MLVSYCVPQIDTVTPHTKKLLVSGWGEDRGQTTPRAPHMYFPVHKANDGQFWTLTICQELF